MTNIGTIYKIKNLKNNKVYIGLTTKRIEKRFSEHIRSAFLLKTNTKLSIALRKYKPENFVIKKIYETFDLEDLRKKEIEYIIKYNSIKKGYNTHKGGNLGSPSGKPITVEGKTFKSRIKMCEHYGITWDNYKFRLKKGWSLEEALGIVPHYNKFLYVGGEPVNYNSISELCKKYNISYRYVSSTSGRQNISIEEAFIRCFNSKLQDNKVLRILSWDAGTKNAALSIIDYPKSGKPILILSKMTEKLVTNMGTSLNKDTKAFIKFFSKIIKKYKPDIISPELFMQRSFRSNLASPISYMIGILAGMAEDNNIQFYPIMPSTWKRKIEKDLVKVDNFYDRSYPIKDRLPDHVIDSVFIGAYHNPKGYGKQRLSSWKKFIQDIKDSTLIQTWLNQEKLKKPVVKKSKRKKKRRKQPLLVKY